ncbi:hypothetical protein JCM14469_34640 [Desulfatiferula olefinivorans]
MQDIRSTKDVDVIVEVASRLEYRHLETRLRQLGFKNSMLPDSPICRWEVDDLLVDIMPTDETILGFSNRWYLDALRSAVDKCIDNLSIRIVTAPYFCATKIEAFHGRGKNDFLGSHDIEDIINLVDGRKELVTEIDQAEDALKAFVATNFKVFLSQRNFIESIYAQFNPDPVSQQRSDVILKRMSKISSIIS